MRLPFLRPMSAASKTDRPKRSLFDRVVNAIAVVILIGAAIKESRVCPSSRQFLSRASIVLKSRKL
ncbi:MAG: hypothetical protein ACOY17_09360 [Pseudomonadota bacterium]